MYFNSYPNRTWCDVLEEIRKCFKTHNYSLIPGLVEELQTFGNRMEASLHDNRDLLEARVELKKLKGEYKDLEAKKDLLEENINLLEDKT